MWLIWINVLSVAVDIRLCACVCICMCVCAAYVWISGCSRVYVWLLMKNVANYIDSYHFRKLYSVVCEKRNNQFISICLLVPLCHYQWESQCAFVFSFSLYTFKLCTISFLFFSGLCISLKRYCYWIRSSGFFIPYFIIQLLWYTTTIFEMYMLYAHTHAHTYRPKPIQIVNIIEWIRKPFNNLSFGVLHRLFVCFVSGWTTGEWRNSV